MGLGVGTGQDLRKLVAAWWKVPTNAFREKNIKKMIQCKYDLPGNYGGLLAEGLWGGAPEAEVLALQCSTKRSIS